MLPGWPGILACGSSFVALDDLSGSKERTVPAFPSAWAVLQKQAGYGETVALSRNGTPRLQWRHRVGFIPTSHDHPE
jgi:hypothetical protein